MTAETIESPSLQPVTLESDRELDRVGEILLASGTVVRQLCAHCKAPEPASTALVELFRLERLSADTDLQLCPSVGCPEFRGTGYGGRRAIAELLLPSRSIGRLIFQGADHNEIERAAIAEGMRPTLRCRPPRRNRRGTTIEEVVRCIRGEV
jgi:general secretion pathway protein E